MTTYIGTAGDDLYTGGKFGDSIDGAGGDDTLDGAAGSDRIQGGEGADILHGGDDGDMLASFKVDSPPGILGASLDAGDEHDILDGGAGADTIAAGYGDDIDGGAGANWLLLNLGGATSGVTADFNDLIDGPMTIGGGVIQNIQYLGLVQGSSYDDVLTARTGFAISGGSIRGAEGNDSIVGGSGSDILYGDAGNDTIDARLSTSFCEIRGGGGDDVIDDRGGAGFREVFGDGGDDVVLTTGTVHGGAGNDVVEIVAGGGRVSGDAGNDRIEVTAPSSRFTVIFGGTGADTLISTDGADVLFSYGVAAAGGDTDFGLEHDVLASGDGNDRLSVGYGDDVDGGGGVDTIVISWVGAAAGVTVTTADITSGPFSFGGGVIQNVEKLSELYFSDHDDVVTVSPQTSLVLVHGQGGSDRISVTDARAEVYGDDGDDTLQGGANTQVLNGGAGNDVFVVTMPGQDIFDGAEQGLDTVRSSVDWTLGANLENLTLAGAAVSGVGNGRENLINGNDAANSLTGLAGDDTLNGNGGADTLLGGDNADRLDGGAGDDEARGGAGDDVYVVDSAGDHVIEAAGQGRDTVRSGADFTLGGFVEDLVLTGSATTGAGNGLDNLVTGNAGANELSGLGGDDTLLGGDGADTLLGGDNADRIDGGSGNDEARGGAGDDLFIVGSTGDVAIEAAGEGRDTVRSTADFALGENIETLLLLGAAAVGTGNAMANRITGNAGENVLSGIGGDDTLTGADGADSLSGGDGADGVDGGAGADTLSGGEGADRLEGGAGGDRMAGGAGDDLYFVDDAADVVFEFEDEGYDTVQASVGHALRANLEKLVLTGSAAIDGAGNTSDNTLTGNNAANRLEGEGGADTLTGLGGNDRLDGGAGVDQMAGGRGDDTYVVERPGDVVVENKKQGLDTVESSLSYTLGKNLENLVLTGTKGASAAGNGSSNEIHGNDAANLITGGAGNDRLFGGLGADTFAFGSVYDSVAARSDLLADFSAEDRLDLSAVDAILKTEADDAFVRVEGAFTGAGQMRLSFDGTNTLVELNVDKNAEPEMIIRLAGDHTAADAHDGWVL